MKDDTHPGASGSRGLAQTVTDAGSRREALVLAALEVFAEQGYEHAALSDIVGRARASIGSLYHHFSNKEGLAQAVYLEGVRRTQVYALERLLRCRSAERGVRVLVAAYLDWVRDNPAWAQFLFGHRRAGFVLPARAELADMNRASFAAGLAWFKRQMERGDLPRTLDPALVAAVIYGPAEHFCKQWLAGGDEAGHSRAKRKLGAAAWAAIQALQ